MPQDPKKGSEDKPKPGGAKRDPKAEERARKPVAQDVFDFHANADTDGSAQAMHHTLGYGPAQASPGTHTHDGASPDSLPLWSGVTLNDPATTATNAELAAAIATLNALIRQKTA